MQVMNLTTPAQYYHMLRRQALQDTKRPAILMTPKSLLRHPMATSSRDELAEGKFQPFIVDRDYNNPENIKRLVICSGKVYYDLLKYRQENDIENVAIARLEQFYPFADDEIEDQLKDFKKVKDIVWCQEEPKNQGAWNFVAPRFMELLQKGQKLNYIGRQASASPAAGQKKVHEAEQNRLVEKAMQL
jgi:2-oxoglutarate dehydrogenase E1 component